MLLTEVTKIIKVADSTIAGTSDVNSTGVDMAADGGWDEVTFITTFATPAADNQLHAEQSSDDAVADPYADLAASEITVDTDDKVQRLNIIRPRERYVRTVAMRGTSTVLGEIYAILSRGRSPYAPTDDYNVKRLVSPAEGAK